LHLKALGCFETSGETHPMVQCRF